MSKVLKDSELVEFDLLFASMLPAPLYFGRVVVFVVVVVYVVFVVDIVVPPKLVSSMPPPTPPTPCSVGVETALLESSAPE